jgi:tetratricopeptide (TPR) repeat protein
VQISDAAPGQTALHRRARAAALLIAAAALVAYGNTFNVPFIFDGVSGIADNASIRKLWPLLGALHPPPGTSLAGRPIANLTFAIDYAISGENTWSYQVVNLLIHILGGIVLFGVARRALVGPMMDARFGRDAMALALVIALLWLLHPLQTEAVTYTVQRVESLMGLFYLLTLYFVARAADSSHPGAWGAAAVAACGLGMGTKEVMVTAPVMVLLFDRTFFAGGFREALNKRPRLYMALAATWIPLAVLAWGSASRQGSAGFETALRPADYWLEQFEAITRYLRLSLWPSTLVFDYGTVLPDGGIPLLLSFAFVVVLAALSAVGLWRWPALGFLGAWFFGILMPTTVVPVATQTVAEHRMYLPIAAPLALVVIAAYSAMGARRLPFFAIPAAALCFLTVGRNATYRSATALWEDTVSKMPGNARAHCSLGLALAAIPGAAPRAIAEYEEALRLHPDYAAAHNDLGVVLEDLPGRLGDATGHFREAVRLRPAFAEAHANLGRLLASAGQADGAIPELEAALRLDPGSATTQFYMGNALAQTGRPDDAIRHYREALRLHAQFPEANNNLGVVLFRNGRPEEGMRRIRTAILMDPSFVPAHFALAAALLESGRRVDALAEFETILSLRPRDPSAEHMVGLLGSGSGP